ncbi:alpha/beta-hydrolase [Diplocarpon rosae]|nr:alpha/beta-hydrolase [Diplocarpon rosae]
MRFTFISSISFLVAVAGAVNPLVDLGYAKYQGKTLENGVNEWRSVRFAAPPTGARRFAAPKAPLKENSTQDATKEGALCVAANEQEGLQYNSSRQYMAEDCLFLGIYAPANATTSSKLPIMFFLQGGGFMSNSNGNFNGAPLVEASGMNMIIVRVNYRVGILGFIAGSLVDSDKKGAVSNNGLRDMIAAAKWVKKHAKKFGGDPDHIVLSGDSSGGYAINILLTSNNGKGFPDLFVGAAVQSPGWGSEPLPAGRDATLTKNIESTGCANHTDPIDCMRLLPIEEFQNKTAKDGWGPTIDGEILNAPHYQMWEQGKFQKVPMIQGTTSNEATYSYLSNVSATTDADIENGIRGQSASVTDAQVKAIMQAYPASLNNISFFSRDVSVKNATLREGNGTQWQRDAAIKTEFQNCVATFYSDMHSAQTAPANYHYRYNLLDTAPGGFADRGLFTPHTSELYTIWGKGNTDGGDPKCFGTETVDGDCVYAIKMMQAYWTSFIRTLSPNTHRLPGTPEWGTWSISAPRRIVLDNFNATMETMGAGIGEITPGGLNQRERCAQLITPIAKATILGLKANETLPLFAKGYATDPTLDYLKNYPSTGKKSSKPSPYGTGYRA